MRKELSYIANGCGGELCAGSDGSREVTGVCTDSRRAEKDKIFAALRGENTDGNDFVPKILSSGGCAIADREEARGRNCIIVPDVREALQRLASYYRNDELSGVKFVGITGSVGKTTTKDMVALAVSAGRVTHKTAGNANSQIGLPITVLDTEKTDGAAVVELGMSFRGEMDRIAGVARPDISIITNIGYSHIENLGTREAIRDEKLRITAFSPDGSALLLNGDEPLLRGIEVENRKIFYVSVSDDKSDCFAENIISGQNGVSFRAHIFGSETAVSLAVSGRHFVMNSLFALAAASMLGVDISKAADALSHYESDGKRQYIYQADGHTVISDCYNASPESMLAALSVLAETKADRRIAVLGDMLELGNEAERLHLLVGSYAAGRADVLVTYGGLAKNYEKDSGIKEVYSFAEGETEKLREFLASYIRPGDAILYKASNAMKLYNAIV